MNEKYTIPAAIIVAGLLIAGAVMYGGDDSKRASNSDSPSQNNSQEQISPDSFRAVTADDHVKGDPNAPITIIEYSDFECPFCGSYHPTLERVVEENSDIKWIYRHFPLSQIHSEAIGSAIASECVADLAGNDAFWQFADTMFENQSSLGQDLYVSTANELGIAEEDLLSCMKNEEIAKEVEADFAEVRSLGATGTPHSLIISADGQTVKPIRGALPFETVMSVITEIKQN